MQQLSIGEFEALILKAFRGAGYSWGVSQEAGRAASWLSLRGLPAAVLFAQLLQHVEGHNPGSPDSVLVPRISNGDWGRSNGPLCPVITGTTISDFGCTDHNSIVIGSMYSPMILVPFIASCARQAHCGLSVAIDETEILISNEGELIYIPEDCGVSLATSVCISGVAGNADSLVVADHRRVLVEESHLSVFSVLAHKTYVPASDESRSGAGAGLTDND